MDIKYRWSAGILIAVLFSGLAIADQDRGKQLWNSVVDGRSCTDCHGETPTRAGKHIKTGKVIEPMAPSVNPDRFKNARKTEKWFRRNCNWTFNRECSAQEKSDILSWLSSQ